jgi:tetratricopeptide (TPR) repeat protein
MIFELGKWADVLAQARELITWSQQHGAVAMGSSAALSTAVVLFHQGGTDKALSLEGSFLPTAREMDELEFLVPCLSFAALAHAAAGNHQTAVALVDEFEHRTESSVPFRARYLPDVLRALFASGQMERSNKLLVDEGDVAYTRDRYAIVCARALVAEARGEIQRALELYVDAAQNWKSYGFLLEEGLALLGSGRCLTALGRTAEASSRLQEARKIFSDLGAAPLLAQTNSYLEEGTALSS